MTVTTGTPVLTGDINLDGVVNVIDMLILLGEWGACPEPCPPFCASDLNDDCVVNVNDYLLLLANWS